MKDSNPEPKTKSHKMNNDLIYVYCISENNPVFDTESKTGILTIIPYMKYYIVTQTVAFDEFSEQNLKINMANMDWLEKNAREHIEVITQIMEQNTVVPFKFGTIFESMENLRCFISDYAETLDKNINAIRNKQEWSVKIYCNTEILTGQISELSKTIRNLEQIIIESSPGRAFLLKKKKADLVQTEVENVIKKYGQNCFNQLNDLSELNIIHNLLPREVSGKQDEMILNLTFLVANQDINEFIMTLNTLSDKYAKIGFEIDYNGPWPPFNFISLSEKHAEQHN